MYFLVQKHDILHNILFIAEMYNADILLGLARLKIHKNNSNCQSGLNSFPVPLSKAYRAAARRWEAAVLSACGWTDTQQHNYRAPYTVHTAAHLTV